MLVRKWYYKGMCKREKGKGKWVFSFPISGSKQTSFPLSISLPLP